MDIQHHAFRGFPHMSDKDPERRPKRQYPPAYEKIIPIALVLIALAIVVVLIVIFAVALGLLP
jgi:hypothetical protein